MTFENKVNNQYFEWLYDFICNNRNMSYRKLFVKLYDTTFDVYMQNDEDRGFDGIELRHKFAYEYGYLDIDITDFIIRDCSILEVVLALAVRCEETIMTNNEYGDRTSQWFWNMIKTLGLYNMTDDNFNDRYVDDCLYNFNKRRYSSDGKGGLFYIPRIKYDLTREDIWTQLCWYIESLGIEN